MIVVFFTVIISLILLNHEFGDVFMFILNVFYHKILQHFAQGCRKIDNWGGGGGHILHIFIYSKEINWA